MQVSRENILHVAYLSGLSLTENEIQRYQNNLKIIFEYFNELQTVETDSVELFLNPVRENQNLYTQRDLGRADEIKESLGQKLILQNAPDHQYGQFKLEAVIKSE